MIPNLETDKGVAEWYRKNADNQEEQRQLIRTIRDLVPRFYEVEDVINVLIAEGCIVPEMRCKNKGRQRLDDAELERTVVRYKELKAKGYSKKEAAGIIGLPPNTLGSRLSLYNYRRKKECQDRDIGGMEVSKKQ